MRRSCESSTARWRGLAPTYMGSSSLRLWRLSAPLRQPARSSTGSSCLRRSSRCPSVNSSPWFKARAVVEQEALDLVRRRVHVATVLGPMLTFAFVLTTAISTWQDGVVEFALALVARLGGRRGLRDLPQYAGERSNHCHHRCDRAAYRRIPGPRRRVHARACGAGRRRRLLRHPHARRALPHVRRDRAVPLRDR